ncbi:MAG: rRNA pseudouridine synthase [Lachnospiraceae bacterium]|nr:rRNA pseudouridine synthase [Lachnospiraceae bacterium]
MRLDRLLAETGHAASRKAAKEIIRAGLVTVEGIICRDSDRKVDAESGSVCVKGEPVAYAKYRYFLMNKPAGLLSASRDSREETVTDRIEGIRPEEYFPVGRLDRDTTGLLLITNDGALSHELLSPKKHVPKTYRAVCEGKIGDAQCRMLEGGLDLGDFVTAPAKAIVADSDEATTTILLTITEGKFHQVKRMVEKVGSQVLKLTRIQMGGLTLPEDLAPGEYREVAIEELRKALKG